MSSGHTASYVRCKYVPVTKQLFQLLTSKEAGLTSALLVNGYSGSWPFPRALRVRTTVERLRDAPGCHADQVRSLPPGQQESVFQSSLRCSTWRPVPVS